MVKFNGSCRGPLCIEGEFIWKLKDKIDRDWLGGYQGLVPMSMQTTPNPNAPPPTDPSLINQLSPEVEHVLSQQTMRCGGCGSKVGAQVLTRALRRLAPRLRSSTRPEIVSGVGGLTPGVYLLYLHHAIQ